ncbi:hypothetical protein LXL04_034162 [Taraxacum kok-saghyz]
MTDAKFADKRAKGLCFRCDGKFGQGHDCPDKTLQVLLVREDEEEIEEEDEEEQVAVDMVSKELTVSFVEAERKIAMQGEAGLQQSETSLQSILRGIPHASEGYLVKINQLTGTEQREPLAHPSLNDLHTYFSDTFNMPDGLPPHRGHKHAITLKSGTEPINVRPY